MRVTVRTPISSLAPFEAYLKLPNAGAKPLKNFEKDSLHRKTCPSFYPPTKTASQAAKASRGARIQKRAIRLVEAKSNPMHRPSHIPSAPRPKVKPNSALVGIPTPQ